MPGPGKGNKGKAKTKKPGNVHAQGTAPASTATPVVIPCQTLDEDEITRCGHPATDGSPKPERCKTHQAQYRKMYVKYKEASKLVDEIKQGSGIPSEEQIERYEDVSLLLEKSRFVRKYVEAIRVERTGRDIHSKRFFLKVDDGHKMRIKILAKEMIRSVEVIDKLQNKAYTLYIKDNPLPAWAEMTAPSPSAEEFLADNNIESLLSKMKLKGTRTTRSTLNSKASDEDDLIDLEIREMKEGVIRMFDILTIPALAIAELKRLKVLEGSPMDMGSIAYYSLVGQWAFQQYARRIIFHSFYMKALGKVSFKDFFMGDDFSMEDAIKFSWLLAENPMGFRLPWFKDAVLEALIASRPNVSNAHANMGDKGNRIEILGGWIYNVTHKGACSNDGWFHLLQMLEPPANVENRFVRLCNNFDDMVSFLSIGASCGLLPPPSFSNRAVHHRMHLSLSGVVITDMIGDPMFPMLLGPIPNGAQRPRNPGMSVWSEMERRSYMFGAIRNEPSSFNDLFLQELKARPDLFQVITRSETDSGRKVEVFGVAGTQDLLPQTRMRTFEAPASLSHRPFGSGKWEVVHSALDILYSTKTKPTGYLIHLERGSIGWFFRFKKFPVKYIVILDAVANRPYEHLAHNVAWAALKVQGCGKGDYEERKYAIAADKFVEKRVKERLAFLPPQIANSWNFKRMVDDL